ncbi:uncharacterized protein LOC120091218 isoform X2 [Benincasa hispida]|uniref:uncharacterized protein LOC120091218 isoform X2 n=1 Tax=Benincasa hispida TaxID=102211 RepID=UPI0018FF8321|nr:uncharacterized protein LOC120091218 isoform X2 [Benincasa hispida]
MAALQILKSTVSPPSISQPNFGVQSSRFFSDLDSTRRFVLLHGRRRSLRYGCVCRRLSFRCAAQDADKDSNGEEPPESLFMKELKKRGITPTSLLEDTNNSDFGLGGEMTGENRDFSRRSAVSTEVNKSLSNQRERSMQLNSEGLEFFGASFVHDGSRTAISPPSYVDPYALLEEERISQRAPPVN